ncbi:MAG: hypothetical protein FWG46_08820 [Treponema sp.]|nr:hypothetical protein [Treponema sp.]
MHCTVSLNELYADYSAELLDRKELEGAVFRHIDEDTWHLNGFTREEYEDYVSWLYPRIRHAIANYRENGSSFESYIEAMVRMTIKEYRMRQTRKYVAETTAWLTQMPDAYVSEEKPEYDELQFPGNQLKFRNPRQVLILILKCSCYVSDDFLERVSPKLGIEPDEMRRMIDKLRELRANRKRKIDIQRERTNCQFFRCLYYERNLQALNKDSIAAQRMQERLKRGRKRLENMRRRLEQMRPDPTNRQIADVMGIAKGTVDFTLHSLKERGKGKVTNEAKNSEKNNNPALKG